MRKVISFLLVVTFIGCSGTKNQYKIEKNAILSFQEAYYQDWTSGVKGGGSGMNVFLVQNASDADEIEIEGIFFHKKYASLKSHGNNKFQGFIKGEANNEEPEMMVGEEKKKEKIETIVETFPFDLKPSEAVVSFFHKGKLKYNKITLVKKKLSPDQIPR